jgi:hypothetical protein
MKMLVEEEPSQLFVLELVMNRYALVFHFKGD